MTSPSIDLRAARPAALLFASLTLLACGDSTSSSASSATGTDSGSSTADGTTQGPPTTGATAATEDGTASIGETMAPTTGAPTTSTTGPATTTTATTDATTGQVSASSSGSTGSGTSSDTTDTSTASGTTGEPCQGAECCEPGEVFCGDVCCAVGEVCSFTKCELPGADCKDEADCGADEYCEYSLGEPEMQPPDPMCMGGVFEPTGKCLKKPPLCGPNDPPPDPDNPECLLSCQYDPAGGFNPTLKFSWGGVVDPPYDSDIMMTPIVVQLDDDDCDGKVTERDIPEIVFSTFANGQYKQDGVLHAISIKDGAVVEKWTALAGVVNPTKQLAGGDFDGLPGNEIVACGDGNEVFAIRGEDGAILWTTMATCFMPAIADLDGDGHVEVIVEGGILDGATGAIKATFSPELDSSFLVSDLDDDGLLDIVTGGRGYHADGTLFVDTQLVTESPYYATSDWKGPWPAIADFDLDGLPEVVVIDNPHHALFIWRYDPFAPNQFELVRAPVDINGPLDPSACPPGSWGSTHGGGPPTVADFDGDGIPDVGTAGGVGYAVFSGKKLLDPNVPGPQTLLW
ncbi:MAG TPA: FG-GAP-like repeat-containing protein, partial [Nannocystis sp.]